MRSLLLLRFIVPTFVDVKYFLVSDKFSQKIIPYNFTKTN